MGRFKFDLVSVGRENVDLFCCLWMVSIGRERNEISGSVYGEEDFEWLCNCQFLIVVIVPYGHKNTMLCFF